MKLKNNYRVKIMVDLINKLNLNNKNILDIGCSDGTLLSLIKNRNNNFFGIESDYVACQKCKKHNINIKKFVIDNKPLPLNSNKFDIIVAGEIIEHLYHTDFFLSEIHRLLKVNGYLIISTPNLSSLPRRLLLFFGLNPYIEISPNLPGSCGHIRYFTPANFKNFLFKNHFKIIHYQSDLVNFSTNGRLHSKLLALLIPQIGQSIILFTRKS